MADTDAVVDALLGDDREVGTELVRAFHDGESWLEPPHHTDWDQRREQGIYPTTTPEYAVPDEGA